MSDEPRLTIKADQGADPGAGQKGPSGKVLFFILLACWLLALAGFTSMFGWIGLSVLGALLANGGISLARSARSHISEGKQYAIVFAVGLLIAVVSLPTLAPGLPGSWLSTTSFGWGLLESRTGRLVQAIKETDIELAARLVSRGLGDDRPIDKFGRPLLFDVEDPEMLSALLEAGLSPDATDPQGRTLLMMTGDEQMAATLLANGADTNAKDVEGRTPLAYAPRKGGGFVEQLLEAGADVYAADDSGVSVADLYPSAGPLRKLLEKYARSHVLPLPRPVEAIDRGRRDWLTTDTDSRSSGMSPSISIEPAKLRYGDIARVTIRLGNDAQQERLLEARAELNDVAYFVAASSGGRIENPRVASISQTIRWPLLALPAGNQGTLQLDVVLRDDTEVGDFSVDFRYREVGEREDQMLQIYQTPGEVEIIPTSLSLETMAGILVFFVIVALIIRAFYRANRQGVDAVMYLSAVGIAVFCVLIAVLMIVSAAEPWLSYEETSCEVLDRRVRLEVYSTSSGTSSSRHMSRSTTTIEVKPMVAARYQARDREYIRAGFSASLDYPVQELYQFPLGATVPCWFDPDVRTRFTLVRAPSLGMYIGLAVLALIASIFFLVAWVLGKNINR